MVVEALMSQLYRIEYRYFLDANHSFLINFFIKKGMMDLYFTMAIVAI